MQTLPFKQVDVFTQKLSWGNPVAVVLEAERLETANMQRIATWTNLSELLSFCRRAAVPQIIA
jgi:PhzF family phenazine biosynthesis protein